MIDAPEHERPRGAVPETTEDHRDHQVASRLSRGPAASTERDVQIVAQPRRQADVPMTPELLRRPHQVWKTEILDQLDSHQLRRAAGDVRVAGEVAVDLEGERINAEQHVHAGRRAARLEHLVGQRREVVGHEDLQEVTPRDQPRSVAQLRRRDPARGVDLREQCRGPENRARHQVGEVGDEDGEVDEVTRRRNLPPVDIDHVAHRHERVERDADWEQHSHRDEIDLPSHRREQGMQVVGEEVEVLEEPEQRQVEQDADPQQALPPRLVGLPVDQQRAGVIDDRRAEQQSQEAPIPGGIEVIARAEQQPVLRPVRQQPVQRVDDDEEPDKV